MCPCAAPCPLHVVLLRSDFAHELRTKVLELVGQLDFLGDSHTVLTDTRRSIGFFDDDVAALRAKRDFHGSGANGKSGAYSPRTHLLRKRTRMLSMDDLFKGRPGAVGQRISIGLECSLTADKGRTASARSGKRSPQPTRCGGLSANAGAYDDAPTVSCAATAHPSPSAIG